jgi:DNA primase
VEAFDRVKVEVPLLDFIEKHVTTRIIKKGRQYFVSCPKSADGDSDPSLAIYPEQNTFYCFHCGGDYYGSIIDFVKGIINTDSNFEALKKLDELYPELKLLDPSVAASEAQRQVFIEYLTGQAILQHNLLLEPENRPYLDALVNGRRISEETIALFGLGIKKMNGYPRLTIPCYNGKDNVLAFVTRQLSENDPRPKYHASNVYIDKQNNELTTKENPNGLTIWEKGSYLYNINRALGASPGGRVFLVEGQLDVIAAHEMGLTAVACGMKVPTREQASLLEPFSEIVISPDTDAIDSVIKTYSILRGLFPLKVIKVFIQPQADIKDFGDLRKAGIMNSDVVVARCLFAERFLIENYNYSEIVDILDIMTEPMGRTLAIQSLSESMGVNAMLFSSTIDRVAKK